MTEWLLGLWCFVAGFDSVALSLSRIGFRFVGCPACLRNFQKSFLWTVMIPNQGSFINVTSFIEVDGNFTVDGMDSYVSDDFGEGQYESCKDVKLGTMNTTITDLLQ